MQFYTYLLFRPFFPQNKKNYITITEKCTFGRNNGPTQRNDLQLTEEL